MPTPSLRKPFNTVRIHTGHGDLIMALSGLQALRELGADPLSPEACVYTRTDSEALARVLWPQGTVQPLSRSAHAPHPRYVIVQHTSVTTVLRNWLTRDYYVNFPERRLLASYAYPRLGAGRRVLQLLTDLRFGTSLDWRRETPSYYALRMWAPLARALGFTETDLMRGLHAAHRTLRGRLQTHVAALPAQDPLVPEVALFPSGGSFQYFPAGFTQTLLVQAGIAAGGYVCYFGPKDPTLEEYRARGIECRITASVDEMLRVVAAAAVTVTADSFVSHVAQHIARQHVALMSHDLPQHTIHPAAPTRVVFAPQACCPCFYHLRRERRHCSIGLEACGVFAMPSYLEASVETLKQARRAAAVIG